MKKCIGMGFVLLLSTQLHAETYSWVDDNGTYNFTEDYSRVPKKFQKKVHRRGEDLPQEVKKQIVPVPETVPRPQGKTGAEAAVPPGVDKALYGGKSRADWRQELDVLEADLVAIEKRMELLRKQIYDPKGVSVSQLEGLKKEYDVSRAAYDQKYKNYSALIEVIRKSGIIVEIRK